MRFVGLKLAMQLFPLRRAVTPTAFRVTSLLVRPGPLREPKVREAAETMDNLKGSALDHSACVMCVPLSYSRTQSENAIERLVLTCAH